MRGLIAVVGAVVLLATLVECAPRESRVRPGARAHAQIPREYSHKPKNSRPIEPLEWPTSRNPEIKQEDSDPLAIEDYELPKSLRPILYDIHLIPYFETPADLNFTFDGYMTVTFMVEETTNSIKLHGGYDLTVIKDSVIVKRAGLLGQEVGVRLVVQSAPNDDRDFLTITLASDLVQGDNYTLEMDFYGHLNDDKEGLYRTFYTNSQGEQVWLGVTHMQSVSARRAFPCWDEPAWKASWKMHIAHAPRHHVIANMPSISDDESVTGMPLWKFTEFEATPPMSSYLVAFAITDFESMLSPIDPRVTLWAQPGRVQEGQYGNDVSPKLLNFMQVFTGVPYTLSKMDQIAVPGFASGAMENWGLLTYRDDLMLFTEGKSEEQDRENTEAICAHEISHQWFGDLVSPKWWDSLWLNEGFAVYFEYNALIDIEPTWQIEERFVQEATHYVMVEDGLQSTHAMQVDGVDSPQATYDMFDSISYSKGGSIVRFMIYLMGKGNFQVGINKYLNERQFNNANMDDLWSGLESSIPSGILPSGATFKQIMDTWTLQAGYPVIRITRDYASSSALITQKRFVSDSSSAFPEVFDVPVTLTTESNPDFGDFRVWGWQRGPELVLNNIPASSQQWIIANIKNTGYYRVNYDRTNWALLAAGLNTRHSDFHQINRCQMINDAMALAQIGDLDYTSALSMTGYLAQELDYAPWAEVRDGLAYINLRMDASLENRNLYANYLLPRLGPVYGLVNGFVSSDSDTHVVKLKRPVVLSLACSLDDVTCNTDGSALFQQWMAISDPDNNNPIPPELKLVTYCAGMRKGGQAEYNFLMARYDATSSTNTKEQETIETALGCSADTAMLTRYLEDSIKTSSTLKGRFCMYAVIDNWRGVDLALDFLIQRWQDALQTYGSYIGIERTFVYLGPKLNTAEQRQKLQTFLDSNSGILQEGADGVISALAALDQTLAWHQTHGQEVVQYFQNNQ